MSACRLFGKLFLCAGAMKAGTSWLFNVLRGHPELHFAIEKEIHYFYHIYVGESYLGDLRRLQRARDNCSTAIDRSRGNADMVRIAVLRAANYVGGPVDDFWYRAQFERPRPEMYACDFSVLTALVPANAWPRIETNCDRLRVLYMLRDPVRQLWSNVKYHLQIHGELDRLQGWGPEDIRNYAMNSWIWENSEYGKAIRRMKAGLSKGTLKVIFYENLHENRSDALADIEDFLEIQRMTYPPEALDQKFNEGERIPMPEYFSGLFAEEAARIRKEVEAEGLILPESWRS